MAKKQAIQYINAYVSGSTAYELTPKPAPKKRVRLPKPRREQKLLLRIYPAAVLGITAAVVLLVMLTAGVLQLQSARKEVAALETYIQTLNQENARLQQQYENGYDLEEIEKIATAMGYVPITQVPTIPIQVDVPQPVQQPNKWEEFWAFLTELFA